MKTSESQKKIFTLFLAAALVALGYGGYRFWELFMRKQILASRSAAFGQTLQTT